MGPGVALGHHGRVGAGELLHAVAPVVHVADEQAGGGDFRAFQFAVGQHVARLRGGSPRIDPQGIQPPVARGTGRDGVFPMVVVHEAGHHALSGVPVEEGRHLVGNHLHAVHRVFLVACPAVVVKRHLEHAVVLVLAEKGKLFLHRHGSQVVGAQRVAAGNGQVGDQVVLPVIQIEALGHPHVVAVVWLAEGERVARPVAELVADGTFRAGHLGKRGGGHRAGLPVGIVIGHLRGRAREKTLARRAVVVQHIQAESLVGLHVGDFPPSVHDYDIVRMHLSAPCAGQEGQGQKSFLHVCFHVCSYFLNKEGR